MFYKDHLNKTTIPSKAIDIVLLVARQTIKPAAKPTVRLMAQEQKQSQPLDNCTNKKTKKNWAVFGFYRVFGLFQDTSNPRINAFSLKIMSLF